MKRLLHLAIVPALVALSSVCLAGPETVAAAAPQGLPKACLDVQTDDSLTRQFAASLKDAVTASGALVLGSGEACDLLLHVPGNLLRFQTASGIMVSTAVIVTSPSGNYLSTSITACQASNLEPCAVRAIAAAKLALMVSNAGS